MGSRVIFFILVLTTRTEFSHTAGKPHFNYNFTTISTLPSTSKKCYVPKIPNTYAYTIKPSLSYREQTLMLQKHNEQRRLQGASDMMIMEWNYDLMYRAQEYADKCVYGHSDSKFRQNIGGFAQLGENLYAQTNKLDLFVALEAWYNEINDYNYQTRACNAVCGHYTQNVWFSSYALGCGIKFCKPLNQPCGSNACLLWEYGYYVVCHYGPGGNVRGHHPFRKGKACSQCETDAVYCICGLCSKRPQIGSDSANSTMQANIIAAAAVAIFISVLF